MRRLIIILLVLAVAGVLAVHGVDWYRGLSVPFKGYRAAERFVEVVPGTGPQAIGRLMVASGVVSDELAWRVALWRSGSASRLKAGEYRFDRAMTAGEVIRKLARGDVFLRSVTFREGLTLRQMARVYEAAGLGPASAFAEAAADASLVIGLDPAARDLEGYLFPDTYTLPRRATAADLVRRMVARFESVFSPALREEAMANGLSIREAVTLASMVEKEAGRADERPLIAAVYQNRLRVRMGLQCDPTVIYALELAGRYNGNLTRADLGVDSPYNTYRHAGLPPGPIASPGRASLEAAARPAPVDYLYFVSRNDGTHAFSATLDEHNRNVRKYQVEFFRGGRAAGPSAPKAAARAPLQPGKR